MSKIKIAVFFDTQADRDTAYAALKPLFVGDDHGVSGGVFNALTGQTPQWQLWATYEGDPAAATDALSVVKKQTATVVGTPSIAGGV